MSLLKTGLLKKLAAIALLLVAVYLVFELSGWRASFNLAFLRETIEANLVAGVAVFVGAFVVGNIIQVPGWVFLAAAVLALGKVAGGVVTYVAAVAACVATYGLIAFWGQGALRELDSPLAKRLFLRLDRHPVSSVVLLRTVFQTVPLLNYSLALSGIKFRSYLLGTLLGLPLPIFLYCLFFEFLVVQVFNVAL